MRRTAQLAFTRYLLCGQSRLRVPGPRRRLELTVAGLPDATSGGGTATPLPRSYDDLYAYMAGESWFVFMNHGYAPALDDPHTYPMLEGDDEKWRHQVLLYCFLVSVAFQVSGRRTLNSCRLLDIGCGRGGGISATKRHYAMQMAVGLDLNLAQVRFCADRHRDVGARFVAGNAASLPFADESFDLVMNVESSHCYTEMSYFLLEVVRILKRGGLFLFADCRPRHRIPALTADLVKSGMKISYRRDITEEVRRACAQDVERFRYVFDSTKREFPLQIAMDKADAYETGSAGYAAYVLTR
jgi:ubiquinone/menaquinone biosynthesis C-methylase UbiE